MRKIVDLWKNVNFETSEDSPIEIINQQIKNLSEKTNKILSGSITTNTRGLYLFHTFYIVAPYLDNYNFPLLDIIQGALPYPCIIYDNVSINKNQSKGKKDKKIDSINKILELDSSNFHFKELNFNDFKEDSYLKSSNSDEFIENLTTIFNSQNTIKIISSLISQSNQNINVNL